MSSAAVVLVATEIQEGEEPKELLSLRRLLYIPAPPIADLSPVSYQRLGPLRKRAFWK